MRTQSAVAAAALLAFSAATGSGASGSAGPTTDAVPFDQATHVSRGFGGDAARVDSQITLNIPITQVAAVYNYLRHIYVENPDFLRSKFPGLPLRSSPAEDISNFTDVYFDTPNLDLYGSRNTVRFRTRVNTTNPEDRKSGRQLVQIKFTPEGGFQQRTELKFEVNPSKKFRTEDDLHPLIRLVERSQRADLKMSIRKVGLVPYDLQPTVTINQRRSRVYLYWGNENILSFSVDEYHSRILWATAENASVDVGLVENAYTAADESRRKSLAEIREFVVQDLRRQFPQLAENSVEKYSLIMAQFIEKVPALRFLQRHKLL